MDINKLQDRKLNTAVYILHQAPAKYGYLARTLPPNHLHFEVSMEPSNIQNESILSTVEATLDHAVNLGVQQAQKSDASNSVPLCGFKEVINATK